MKVLILAAGVGSRLGKLVKDKPKCLLRLDNTAIIDYQLRCLMRVGNFSYSDVFVVGGYKFETLQYLTEKGVNLIFNPKCREWNNIYSFYLAKEYITEDFILINGDTIFHPKILKNLLGVEKGTCFVIDNIKKLGEEEMKVLIKDERILKFGKDINPETAHGEYIGLARFDINDAKIVFEKMGKLIESRKTSIWYELAINYVLDKIIAKPIFTNNLPWIEIDTPDDYEKAETVFKKVNAIDL